MRTVVTNRPAGGERIRRPPPRHRPAYSAFWEQEGRPPPPRAGSVVDPHHLLSAFRRCRRGGLRIRWHPPSPFTSRDRVASSRVAVVTRALYLTLFLPTNAQSVVPLVSQQSRRSHSVAHSRHTCGRRTKVRKMSSSMQDHLPPVVPGCAIRCRHRHVGDLAQWWKALYSESRESMALWGPLPQLSQ